MFATDLKGAHHPALLIAYTVSGRFPG